MAIESEMQSQGNFLLVNRSYLPELSTKKNSDIKQEFLFLKLHTEGHLSIKG